MLVVSPSAAAPLLRTFVVVLCLAACSDDSKQADVPPTEVSDGSDADVDLTGQSVYALDLVVDGNEVKVDRDLTGLGQYFAFGSTHIAPAVSFGMTDSIQFPRTMTNTINFGIVVPSEAHPIQTPSTGTYTFSAKPPNVDIFVSGLQYRSTNAGSAGSIVIDQWGVSEGDTVSGTFQGSLVADGSTGRTISVTGRFHFTLPAPNAGQPN